MKRKFTKEEIKERILIEGINLIPKRIINKKIKNN